MVNSETVLKGAPVALLLMALIASGQGVEKLASCFTSVNSDEIKEPILGYIIQERNLPCVTAVIFLTNSGLYCSRLRAPWVYRKIKELRAKNRSLIPSSSASLLSTLTSTATPSSSSALLSSSSSSELVTPPEVTSSSASLLSIMTSTASPSSSSTLLSSSSSIDSDSAPTEQVDETFWDVLSSSASPSSPADEEMPPTYLDEIIS
uniref:Chemokine interleukin-8-like domain-containing protein n=1 Tax=Oryzias latipes TaxID=8090 RepID=A0A3P9HPA7_ORYLA